MGFFTLLLCHRLKHKTFTSMQEMVCAPLTLLTYLSISLWLFSLKNVFNLLPG